MIATDDTNKGMCFVVFDSDMVRVELYSVRATSDVTFIQLGRHPIVRLL